MSGPKNPRFASRLSTEALLQLVSGAAQRMARLSRDPEVRREALNASQAVGRLLKAIRQSGSGQSGVGQPGSGPK